VPDNRQFAASGSVFQVAKMANLHEAFGQNVHSEPPHEVLAIQQLGLQSGMIPIVLIAEGDSVSVVSQIIHHALGLVQAVSSVDHSFVLHQTVEHAINLTAAGYPVQFACV
jgi:predicted ThiF/HesA family dinucleotide-utilizing enzyme